MIRSRQKKQHVFTNILLQLVFITDNRKITSEIMKWIYILLKKSLNVEGFLFHFELMTVYCKYNTAYSFHYLKTHR